MQVDPHQGESPGGLLMKPRLKTASWTALAAGFLLVGTANLQAQVARVTTTVPNQGAAGNRGAAAGYRSNMTRTVRQGMPVRGSNMGNLNGLNYGMGQVGAYPGMYQGGYPGMN